MTQPGIEPQSSGTLANTLPTWPMSWLIQIKIRLSSVCKTGTLRKKLGERFPKVVGIFYLKFICNSIIWNFFFCTSLQIYKCVEIKEMSWNKYLKDEYETSMQIGKRLLNMSRRANIKTIIPTTQINVRYLNK